jgi:Protein of unknown function (DUF4058)
MPMQDWTQVPHGIFHAFHHEWISEIGRTLNRGLLPRDYYALPEQLAAGFGPDGLTLQEQGPHGRAGSGGGVATAPQARPRTRFMAETESEFHRRKKSTIVVRHVSGDRIVAMIEIVSPGNKATQSALHAFVNKACELLEHRIHLLMVDLLSPSPRDPQGIHAAIWAELENDAFCLPTDQPLTLVAYECDLTTRAYIEPIAVGQPLPDMPLYLEPNHWIAVPLEATYGTAFAAMPRRWRDVLEPPRTAG